MDPIIASLILSSATNAVGGAMQSNANAKLTKEQLAQQEAQDKRAIAAREAMLNPFRQQGQQVNSVAALDKIENSRYTPVKLSPSPSYASAVPAMSGGTSYQRSDAVRRAAGAAKTSVLAGKTAPTMTDPLNYGRTAALTLDANGNPVNGGAGGAGGGTRPVSDVLTSYQQGQPGSRPGDKTWGLRPGSKVRGLAASASTDYAVADASDAIARSIQYYQGRDATSQEIDQILRGQGWKPGDRWVGKDGLASVLNIIAAGAGR